MPFKSEKQRRYLWANEPKVAREWTDRYGAREGGGIMEWAGQGGMKNFLGEQEMVSAPKYWQSAPDHEMTELAYITPKERDVLVDMNMYGTMNGSPNEGPSGLMSLNGWGSIDSSGNEVGMSGTATSAAETGSSNAKDRAEIKSHRKGPALPPGVEDKDTQDYRSAFINAGGGRRVNPGFFDSKYTVSPEELMRAREYRNRRDALTGKLANPYAKKAYRKTSGGGIMGFLKSGGLWGNLIRGLGRGFGLGKKWNEPTYDMSEFSGYGLGGSEGEDQSWTGPKYYNDLDNELMLSTEATPEEDVAFDNVDMQNYLYDQSNFKQPNTPYFNIGEQFLSENPEVRRHLSSNFPSNNGIVGVEEVETGSNDILNNAMMASNNNFLDMATKIGLTDKQQMMLDQRKGMLEALGPEAMLNNIQSEDDPNDPATLDDVKKYYGIPI